MLPAVRRFEISCGFAAALLVAGCGGPDRIEKAELVPIGTRDFEYHVATDMFYSPGVDGEAERLRLQWLASDVNFAQLCPRDYDLLSRQVVFQYQTPLGYPINEIIYRGRCRV